jgi:membrane peptidoglycan carboxypeptidase
MGASKQLVCGVWMGYDRPKELYGSAGGSWCAPAWRSYMVQALDVWRTRDKVASMVEDARATDQRRLLAAQFKKYVRVRVCNESGLLANAECRTTRIIELTSAEGVPTQQCNIPAHTPKVSDAKELGDGSTSSQPQPGDLGFSPEEPARRDTLDTPRAPAQDDGESTTDNDSGGESENTRADSAARDNAAFDTPTDTIPQPEADEPPARRSAPTRARERRAPVTDSPVLLNEDVGAEADGGEVVATVCADSGELATRYCPVTAQRFFAASDVPTRSCRQHRR